MLQEFASVTRARENKAYFKSPFGFLGVTKADVNTIGRKLEKELRGQGRVAVIQTVQALWASGIHERMSLAVVLASLSVDEMRPQDVLGLFSRWLDRCQTWDHVDELSIKVVGVLALRYPSLWPEIEGWARVPHMWKKRASLISHLPAVRAGRVDADQLERICRRLAPETDFFIRKAIGWVLRELSEVDREKWARTFKGVGGELSSLSQREATRKLPANERYALLAAVTQKQVLVREPEWTFVKPGSRARH